MCENITWEYPSLAMMQSSKKAGGETQGNQQIK
jgi:hypothetical protein